jgi:hypothetical protein
MDRIKSSADSFEGRSGRNNGRYKTGLAKSGSRSGVYNSWQNMKQRCLNKNHHKYSRYGGRGIAICQEWLTIRGFYDWALQSGWQAGLTLDRIDNEGNYCPENCRWVSLSENSKKKSTTKLSEHDAHKIRYRLLKGDDEREIAKDYGVSHGSVWFVKNGVTHIPN